MLNYPDPARLPMDFGDYRLTDVLGRGGMGVVYKAHKRSAAEGGVTLEMAVKVIKRSLLEEDPGLASSMLDEAREISKVRHPSVVQLLDVGDVDGVPYLGMEVLQGEALDARLKRGALSKQQLFYVGLRICQALGHMHKAHLVHRDLKPSNVFLTVHNEVKLLDFGIAKPTESDARDRKTATGFTKGTPGYLSPEQGMAKPVDARTDLFALGLVLAECATGDIVYNGGSVGEVYQQLFQGQTYLDNESVKARVDRAIPGLGDLVLHLLAQDPAARPSSAAQVERALQDLSGGIRQVDLRVGGVPEAADERPTEAHVPSPAPPVAATELLEGAVAPKASVPASTPAAPSVVQERGSKKGVGVALGGVAVLAVLGVVGLLVLAVGAGVAVQAGVLGGGEPITGVTPPDVPPTVANGALSPASSGQSGDDEPEVVNLVPPTKATGQVQPSPVLKTTPPAAASSVAGAVDPPSELSDAEVRAKALRSAILKGLPSVATAKVCKPHGATELTVWVSGAETRITGTGRGVGCYERAVNRIDNLPDGEVTLTVGPY